MAPSVGISGLAVGMAAAGGVLLTSGIKNATVADTLRALMRGEPIPSQPSLLDTARAAVIDQVKKLPPAGGIASGAANPSGFNQPGAGNAAIADTARAYLGTPYVFGGHSPGGFDCSGLVTWVLVHDLGQRNLPNAVHTVVSEFLTWGGADTIGRDQCAAGDLVIYGGSHMGIATTNAEMIHAPLPGGKVEFTKIWAAPTIRRVRLT